MWSQQTHASLLLRLRDGADHVAWQEFDLRYRDLIVRYGRQRGLQAADAEDVRQAVMMNLARALPAFRYDPAKGRFRAYLGRAVKNAVLRHQNRRPATSELEDTIADPRVPEPDPLWEREWMLHHYRMAMRTVRRSMSPRSVAVFDRILAGEAVNDVAARYGMSAQAIHKVKQRVRNRLQDLVATQLAEEG